MSTSRRACLAAALALSFACAPLTFSHESRVDFRRFRHASVAPVAAMAHAAYAQQYLVSELRASSGFARVTTGVGGSVDLVIEVDLVQATELSTDEDGDTEVEYTCDATFVARARDGSVVDSGSASVNSHSSVEAVEDALDWIVHHYLRPYRA